MNKIFTNKLNHLTGLIFFSMLLTNITFSQIQMSVWGGINSASFGGNPPEDAAFESIYGMSFGANLDFNLTKDAIISLEPSFEQKGSKIVYGDKDKFLDTVRTYGIYQNYYGLGVLFKIDTKRFFAGGGINLMLLSSADLEYESTTTDVKDKFLNYDISSFFNAGFKIPIGAPTLFIEVRYIQGLLNINNADAEDTEIMVSNFKSRALKFSTGLMFPL